MGNYLRSYFLLICFAPLSRLVAQKTPIIDSVSQLKWEVGPDLAGLIDKNILPRYSLIVRRKIGQHGAIRLRGGIDYVGSAMTKYDARESKAYQIRLGYEYRSILRANKAYLYYGVDFLYAYDHEFFSDYSHPVTVTYPGGFNISTLFITKEVQEGGSLFIGYKHFIDKRVSLSLESSLQITSWRKNVVQIGVDSFDYHSTNYQAFPLSCLSLSLHF